jgi:hypothetical protein
MRRLPLVAALIAASLGVSAFVAVTTTAQAATARAVTLRTSNAFPQVDAELHLYGRVSATPNGSRVRIQSLQSGTWTAIGDATTNAVGDFAFDFLPQSAGTTTFRAVALATPDLAAATSPTLTLSVSSRPPTESRFDTAPIPTVVGTSRVGDVLTAMPGTWSPSTTLYYRWVRDGVKISAYGKRYRLTPEDVGKRVTVAVSSPRSGAWTRRESRPSTVVALGTFTTQAPTISGEARAGQTLTASITGWKPGPATLTYQWSRDRVPIVGGTDAQYTVTPEDVGSDLSVEVRGESAGYEPATRVSTATPVAGPPPPSSTTFASQVDPSSTTVLPKNEGTFTTSTSTPSWGTNKLTRWDQPGAFTHSLDPQPAGTLYSDYYGYDIAGAAAGAEYVSTNSVFKNADVSFQFTGRTFAIEHRAYSESDAMVWIDDKPVAAAPIIGKDGSTRASRFFIRVNLPERKTVDVRFAGPFNFTGVHTPAADGAEVKAVAPPFTVGVVSDSFYEYCANQACMSRSAAPVLSSLSGFRVWNMSEMATGYIRDGSWPSESQDDGVGRGIPGHKSSPYGSARRLEALRTAPIDALLVAGSANDTVTWTPAQHRAALDRYLTDVAAVRPDLPVVLVGIEPLDFTKTSQTAPHYRALTSSLAGMVGRHRNVSGFIDPYTDPWLTGTGSTADPHGDGNQDMYVGRDGAHLSGDGQAYYQGRIVEALKKLPLPAMP